MSVWNFDESKVDNVSIPKDIVEEMCDELAKITKGKMVARIQEYDGRYRSGENDGLLSGNVDIDFLKSAFNVQKVMGENASANEMGNKFVYEMYITSKNTPNYRYRVLIMYYGLFMYPVGLTLQEDIAEELGMPSEGIEAENEKELKQLIGGVLGTDTIGKVLNNLARLNA